MWARSLFKAAFDFFLISSDVVHLISIFLYAKSLERQRLGFSCSETLQQVLNSLWSFMGGHPPERLPCTAIQSRILMVGGDAWFHIRSLYDLNGR